MYISGSVPYGVSSTLALLSVTPVKFLLTVSSGYAPAMSHLFDIAGVHLARILRSSTKHRFIIPSASDAFYILGYIRFTF